MTDGHPTFRPLRGRCRVLTGRRQPGGLVVSGRNLWNGRGPWPPTCLMPLGRAWTLGRDRLRADSDVRWRTLARRGPGWWWMRPSAGGAAAVVVVQAADALAMEAGDDPGHDTAPGSHVRVARSRSAASKAAPAQAWLVPRRPARPRHSQDIRRPIHQLHVSPRSLF